MIDAAPDRVKDLLAAQARAALRAIDLSAELGRRADRLLVVASKLRARGAGIVIDRLLSDDAMVASEAVAGMSDRSLRRLFDRELDHLPPQMRWRDWMNRVEATRYFGSRWPRR